MVKVKSQFLVDDKGRKKAILIPIKEYEELMEDIEALAIMAKRKSEPTESMDDVMARLAEKWRTTE